MLLQRSLWPLTNQFISQLGKLSADCRMLVLLMDPDYPFPEIWADQRLELDAAFPMTVSHTLCCAKLTVWSCGVHIACHMKPVILASQFIMKSSFAWVTREDSVVCQSTVCLHAFTLGMTLYSSIVHHLFRHVWWTLGSCRMTTRIQVCLQYWQLPYRCVICLFSHDLASHEQTFYVRSIWRFQNLWQVRFYGFRSIIRREIMPKICLCFGLFSWGRPGYR